MRRQADAHSSHWLAEVIRIAQIAEVKFIQRGRAHRFCVAKINQLRAPPVECAETGDVRAALSNGVGIVLRPIVQEVVGGYHSPARVGVEPVGTLVVAQILVESGRGKCPIRIVGRGNVFQQVGRGRGPCLRGDHGAGENAGCGGASGRVVGFAGGYRVSQPVREDAGPTSSAHGRGDRASRRVGGYKRTRQIRQIAGLVLHRRNGNLARINSLGRASSLIIREEKDLILSNRTARRAAELVLIERPAGGRKIVARVEVRVAREFKRIAVKCVRAGFRHDVDLAAAELAVFRIEVVREDPELRDGIEVRNDRRAHVDVFFHVASIHEESVRKLPLAVDGNGAGIQIAGGGECAGTHVLDCFRRDGSDRSYAGLQ